jgi:hypothetical protein
MGVSVCALDRVIGATNGQAAGLQKGPELREISEGVLPAAMQRAKLQSSAQTNLTGEGTLPLQ